MKKKLSKEHLAELKASGLTNETIELANIYTETSSTNICKLLNCDNPGAINGASKALVFPFGYDGFSRLKLDHPRARKSNKTKQIKYEAPWGSTQHPYFPPGTFDEIVRHDDEREIFFVEGEKKALKLWQEFKCHEVEAWVIGLTGVFGYKVKGKEILLPWLEDIKWSDRIVYLCFDNDVHWNKEVSEARKRFAALLRAKGAKVKAVDIPITDPSRKYGVDDYIVEFGISSFFKECLAEAQDVDIQGIIKLDVQTAQEIEVVPIEWLWHRFIPKGEITLLDGNPGLGKSQMVADLAARVSKGFAMPPLESGTRVVEPGNVLMLCAEDTIEKTVKPRLHVCDADMSKVYFMKGRDRQITFPKDLIRLEAECLELDIEFVVIDPIMSYIGKDIDTHSDQSARECLNRLKEFAEHTNIAIMCLRHLNKRQGETAIFRGGGSIAFTAASRCNLMVGRHPDEEDINVLAVIKSNLDRIPKSLTYSIEEVPTVYGRIGQVNWLDEVELKGDEIVDEKHIKKTKKLDQAADMITELLMGNGPMLSAELQQLVIAKLGISTRTYKTANRKCAVMKGREKNPKAPWWSKLPGQSFAWEPSKRRPTGA